MKFINNSRIKKENIFRIKDTNKTRLDSIRLDKNERSDLHEKKFFLKLKKNINSNLISAYPEFNRIYNLVAKKYKLSRENLLFTAGSDQALKNTFELFYKKNKSVITIDPTFAMVDIYCKIFQSKQIKIQYDNNLNLRINELYKSINSKVCLIIIANPNSPTGTIINKDVIEKILKKAKKFNIKLLIDEAYFEFSTFNCLNLIKKYNNLIIIRTFSKAFGIAGLRGGYVASNKDIIKKYFAIKPMYEINSIAVKAIELLISNNKLLKRYLLELKDGENYAKNFCKLYNYKFIKCYANFFHVSFGSNPKKIQKYLEKKKILVKGGPGVINYEDYLRISLADKKKMKVILKKIKFYLKNYNKNV